MLYDLLIEYNKSGVVPLHMPGHKRNTGLLGDNLPYGIDITEIGGFDDLHHPDGILKELSDAAARLYGAGRAFSLVNGATGGILAAVRSAACESDTIIMARNCHKSVYNAVLMNKLKPVYLLPETDEPSGACGSVTPEQVARAMEEYPGAKLVVVTSPTYEGVVSDIRGICETAHRFGVPVLVDAAHGAHLGFSEYFPPGPAQCGADVMILSLHKTLPALTQCALALVNSGRIDEARLSANLSIFQTSSPSYVLLSSIDRCVRLLSADGERLFAAYEKNLKAFDSAITGLQKLSVLCHGADVPRNHPSFFGFDPGKLVLVTRGTNLTGPALLERLRSDYRLELEMASCGYAVAMTSICDAPEAFVALAKALGRLDSAAGLAAPAAFRPVRSLPEQALAPGAAGALRGERRPLVASAGTVSLEYIWAYPPGIPFLVPGEVIDDAVIEQIGALRAAGVSVRSSGGGLPSSIFCAGRRI